MNIPDRVKIGGKTYSVEVSDVFYSGAANVSAEILFNEQIIRLAKNHEQSMQCDFLHEVVHGILSFMGQKDHDEVFVEAFAQALYTVINDNPDIFK